MIVFSRNLAVSKCVMIDRYEILDVAKVYGLLPLVVEKDYVLGHKAYVSHHQTIPSASQVSLDT